MDFRYFIARRYLATPRRISLISIITGISIAGVTIGVAVLLVVLSVMNGFFEIVRDMMVTFNPHVRIEAIGPGFSPEITGDRGQPLAQVQYTDEAAELLAWVQTVPHVEHASAYVEGKALFMHEGDVDVNKVVIVRGVAPAEYGQISEVPNALLTGAFDLEKQDRRAGIVVGNRLAVRLGLSSAIRNRPASEVRLLSAANVEQIYTQPFSVPRHTPFAVRGTYELDQSYDENHVFVDITEAQRLFRMGRNISGIEMVLDDLERAEAVKAALQTQLDPTRFRVQTWYDLQKSLFDVMRLEKWGYSLVLSLIILVAVFNIVGSLTMIVIEKRQDLGVLQAMGVSRKNIRRIFLTEGALIGCIGAALGLLLGLGLAALQAEYGLIQLANAEMFDLKSYPVSIHGFDVGVVLVVAMGLCMLAALYPALRAAAVDPVRAIHDNR